MVTHMDIEEFRRKCIINNKIACDWSILHEYLLNRTVATYWWNFTRKERDAIADAVIPSIPKLYRPVYIGTGDCGCRGTNIKWDTPVCGDHAAILLAWYGSSAYGSADACTYWKDTTGGIHCLGEESYYLPVYDVYITPRSHAMCALLLEKDYKDINSWRIFQMDEYNARPSTSYQIQRPGMIRIAYKAKTFYGGQKFYVNSDGSVCNPAGSGCGEGIDYNSVTLCPGGKITDPNTYKKWKRCHKCKWIWESQECPGTHHKKKSTKLTMEISKTEVNVQDTVKLEGKLETADAPIENAVITMYKNSIKMPISTLTNHTGNYRIYYKLMRDDVPYIMLHVKFAGTMDFLSSKSPKQRLNVLGTPSPPSCPITRGILWFLNQFIGNKHL